MSAKRLQLHPLVIWVFLLIMIFGLAALSMGLLVLVPNSVGLTLENYAINSAFSFDEWEINTRHGIISFPEGGLVVEAYQYDRLAAFVIWGKAKLEVLDSRIDVAELEDMQVTSIFMSEKELLAARGSTYIRSTESPDAYLQASQLLNSEERFLPILQLFGNQRLYPFPQGVARAVFLDGEGQRFVYQDGMQVSLQGVNSKQGFWTAGPRRFHPSLLEGALASVFYGCGIFILLIATYFSTLGWQRRQRDVPNLGGTFYLLTAAACYTLGRGFLVRLGLDEIVQITYDALFLGLFAYCLKRQQQQPRQPRKLLARVGLGLLVGCLGMTLGQLATPKGLAPQALGDYIFIIGGGLVFVLTQEALWRGLILERLHRRFGNRRGLLLTAGLQGLLACLAWLIYPVSTLGPLNTLLFLPLQAIWLGYTYLRTGDLVASSTIGACLIVLPQLLLF